MLSLQSETLQQPQQQQFVNRNWNEDRRNHEVVMEHHSATGEQQQEQFGLARSEGFSQTEPNLGEINLFAFTPELLQPFMGRRDVDRDDDPWNRPYSYRDGNLQFFSDGRNRVRRDTFGSTRKMYLYEIGTSPAEKAFKQFQQWSNSFWQPINFYPINGHFMILPPLIPRFGKTTKITITPPVVEEVITACDE